MKYLSSLRHFLFIILIIFLLIFSLKSINRDSLDNSDLRPQVDIREVKNNTDYNISAETILHFETHYLDCGHIEIVELLPSETIIGADIDGLLRNYPGWMIDNYSERYVNMYKYEDGLCPNHYFLGIKDGYVTVFYKRTGEDRDIKEITEIKADLLRADDRSLLENGIEVYGENELLKIKEGLTN